MAFILAFVGLSTAYLVIGAIWRLYFSPISKFPGPKMAALTWWYEYWYDVVLQGQYMHHIAELHTRYGPIIRINPEELHIVDPAFIETLYTSSAGGKRDKFHFYVKQFDTPGATFSTIDHDLHKMRRSVLNPYFSVANVRKLQPVIEKNIDFFLNRVSKQAEDEKGTLVPLEHALSALTNDIVTEYSYGQSEHCLAASDWKPAFHHINVDAGKLGRLVKQSRWIFRTILSLPEAIQIRLSPYMADLYQYRVQVEGIIKSIMAGTRKKGSGQATIFHEILDSRLSKEDKSVLRLRDEALIVVGAGTITTSWTMCCAIFYILRDPSIYKKLKQELKDNPDTPPQNLLYLRQIIQESLRLSYGVVTRLQRSSHTDLTYNEWTIPKGTPVGMSSGLIHHDETIFPDSHAFKPERWEQPGLEKYLLSFSKGSRQCLGINLAYAELHLFLAAFFRRFRGCDIDGAFLLKEEEGQDSLKTVRLDNDNIYQVRLDHDAFGPGRDIRSSQVQVLIK